MSEPDEGYFPRGESMLRRVHEERAVGLLYGQRALAIGAIAPLNFEGTKLHTRALDRPFRRLVRTAKMFETIFFGTRAEADEVLEIVGRLHQSVKGTLPEDVGPVPAGTPYSALDPELMLWTMAVMADSAQVFYELFVRRLTDDERERYWDDYVRFAELFGMPRDAAPPNYREFRRWYDAKLAGPDVHLTEEARYVSSAIMFEIPVPTWRTPVMKIHNLIIRGSLPPGVREMFGLSWTRAHQAAFRTIVSASRAPRPLLSDGLRYGFNTAEFDMVADTERRRAERGQPIPGALATG